MSPAKNKVFIRDVRVIANQERVIVTVATPSTEVCSRFSFPLDITVISCEEIESLMFFAENDIHELVVPNSFSNEGATITTSFSSRLSVIGLRKNFSIQGFVKFKEGRRLFVLRIEGERDRLIISERAEFQPICLNGIPRSGTTLAMGLVQSHPMLVTTNRYPFEHRPALYWAHMFQAMSRPNNAVGGHWNWAFEAEREKIGAFTYYNGLEEIEEWVEENYIRRLADFCRENIDSVYKLIGRRGGKSEACFFIEKFPGWKGKYFAEIYSEYHEIVIVRDIRDVFCSVKKFNERRGRRDFGVDNFANDKGYFSYLGNLLKNMTRKIDHGDDRHKRYIIRYEDVIADPINSILNLYQKIGLPVCDDVVRRLISTQASPQLNNVLHRTGKVEQGSINRWKEELSQEESEYIWEQSGDILKTLGYEAS